MRRAAWLACLFSSGASAEGLDLELRGSLLAFPGGAVQALELDAGVHGANGGIVVSVPLLFAPESARLRQEGAVFTGLSIDSAPAAAAGRVGLGGPRAAVSYVLAADVLPWVLANAFVGSVALTVPSGALGGPAAGGLDLSAAVALSSGFLRARDFVSLEVFWLGAGGEGQQPALQLAVGSGLGMGDKAWVSASGAARWLPFQPGRWRAQLEVGGGYWITTDAALRLSGMLGVGEAPLWGLRLAAVTEL